MGSNQEISHLDNCAAYEPSVGRASIILSYAAVLLALNPVWIYPFWGFHHNYALGVFAWLLVGGEDGFSIFPNPVGLILALVATWILFCVRSACISGIKDYYKHRIESSDTTGDGDSRRLLRWKISLSRCFFAVAFVAISAFLVPWADHFYGSEFIPQAFIGGLLWGAAIGCFLRDRGYILGAAFVGSVTCVLVLLALSTVLLAVVEITGERLL